MVVAVSGTGLQVVDALTQEVLATQPRSARITSLTVVKDTLLAVEDGNLVGFTVAGNAIEPRTTVSGISNVLDVQGRGRWQPARAG